MKRAIASVSVLAAVLALAAGIAWPDEDDAHHDDDSARVVEERFYGFDVLPLSRAADLVEERFHGKLIAANLVQPRNWERQKGVELVHELRLLTPRRDVLVFRLDARTGAFLDIAGAGLTQARRQAKAAPQ